MSLPLFFGALTPETYPFNFTSVYRSCVESCAGSPEGRDPQRCVIHKSLKAKLTSCRLWKWHCLGGQTGIIMHFSGSSSTHNVNYVKVYEKRAKSVKVPMWNQSMKGDLTKPVAIIKYLVDDISANHWFIHICTCHMNHNDICAIPVTSHSNYVFIPFFHTRLSGWGDGDGATARPESC